MESRVSASRGVCAVENILGSDWGKETLLGLFGYLEHGDLQSNMSNNSGHRKNSEKTKNIKNNKPVQK